ncbi:PAS domain-containing protein [Spirosoma sordidisoli]|uniref:histidine kinase n=1 Tax=Spirosoma sordidisoli TaxID=2502893 RepID=A0A4Q2UUW7_9BACT|nr:PAS domain-containing protein [Spirosoma sordidisoli]RYC71610.1 PAS domain-containing protein [Spirosoma sordidisoli]
MLTDSTDHQSLAELTEQLDGILNASLNGIITYESVRDQTGQIIDFKFIRLNKAAKRMLGLTDAVIGEPMLDQLPGVKEGGLFDIFVQVVDTGEPARFETPYPDGDQLLWYDMAVVKLADGFVITFNDITLARQNQQALEEQSRASKRQADLLNSVLDSSASGIKALEAVRDEAGRVDYFKVIAINKVGAALRGKSVGDLVGKRASDVFPGIREHGLFDQYVRVTETREPHRFETWYELDGHGIWLDITLSPFYDGLVVTYTDVTEQHQAAVQKERQANFLNKLLDASSNGIVAERAIRNAEGDIVDFLVLSANQQAATISQSTVDALVGQRDLELHPNLRESGLFDAFVKTIETGQPQVVETYYDDGRLSQWLNVNTRKLADEELVITFSNVSAEKYAQLALEQAAAANKAQAELMHTMLDGAINGVLLLEPIREPATGNEPGAVVDFRILAANRAVEQLTGADPVQAIGRTMQDVYPGYRQAGFFALYCETLATGEQRRAENYYEDEVLKGWFEVSSVRQGEQVVLTFANTTEVRRAQQALKQAAADLQAVIDRSPTGIFVFSPVYDEAGRHVDFRFKTINRMVAAMVGQTPEVLTGAIASAWFTSYRETGLFERYRYTFDTGEEQRFSIHYDVDGFDLWFDVHAMKFGQDVLVTFTNFTDLKQAQLAVERQAAETKRQADLLDSVLNSSNSGIMSFEAIRNEEGAIVDFGYVTVNQASEQLVGYPVDFIKRHTLLNLFPGNVESGLFAMYVNTTETGEPTRTELHYNHDGLDFWIDVSAQKLGDGFVVTFSDVSAVKRASQLIERSAVELQTVIDTSQTGIFLFSPVHDKSGQVVDFRFRVANRQLASYVGQDPAAVVGALGSTWFPGYQSNGLFDAYHKTYVTGEPQRFDFHYNTDGIDVWLDILTTKMGDEVLVTFGDYTPLKLLQQQLQASVVDLQRSNRNLEQFAYVASHDLQEPLRKIQAFGDIIQTKYVGVMDAEGVDMIRRMQSAAARMQVLIKDVLAYSRVATKREEVEPVELNPLIDDVLIDLETAIADKRAHIQVHPLPTVPGDGLQLRQLFQNLVSNSLKFTRPDQMPEVIITGQMVRGKHAGLPVSVADEGRWFCRIDVSDNGIGFDPRQADRIFQVFQRLHGRSEYQGTGIGLAIVQKVVENHHGYIQADGRPGQGATFSILLPA